MTCFKDVLREDPYWREARLLEAAIERNSPRQTAKEVSTWTASKKAPKPAKKGAKPMRRMSMLASTPTAQSGMGSASTVQSAEDKVQDFFKQMDTPQVSGSASSFAMNSINEEESVPESVSPAPLDEAAERRRAWKASRKAEAEQASDDMD